MSGERSSRFRVQSPMSAERCDTREAQSGGAGDQCSTFKVPSLVSVAAGRVDAAKCSRHGAGRKDAEGRSRRGEVRRVWFGAKSRLSAVPSSLSEVPSLEAKAGSSMLPGCGLLVGRGSCRAETLFEMGLGGSLALPRLGKLRPTKWKSTSSLHCAQRDG